MSVILRVTSEEYGSEDFVYDTFEEAYAGEARIMKEAEKLNDGVERWFRFIVDGDKGDE